MPQLFGGEVIGAAVQEALVIGLRPAGEGVDAVPAGGVQAHAAASFRGFPVEGLLPRSIQVPDYCSAARGFWSFGEEWQWFMRMDTLPDCYVMPGT